MLKHYFPTLNSHVMNKYYHILVSDKLKFMSDLTGSGVSHSSFDIKLECLLLSIVNPYWINLIST